MKKTINILSILAAIFLYNQKSMAQTPTVAWYFNMHDCNGQMHHLFSELDSGNVVVMEYFMLSCSPCIDAGHALNKMVVPLKQKYGNNKVRFYQFGFVKSYNCTQIKNWITTNGFANAVPFDSGDVQVAYYGGMGMPTIAIVGGKDHKVLHTTMAFTPGDTAVMSKSIHDFFAGSLSINNTANTFSAVAVYPNPATTNVTISLEAEKAGMLYLTLNNLQGQRMAATITENLKAGAWTKTISLPLLANGIYFLQGEMNGKKFTEKITIFNQ